MRCTSVMLLAALACACPTFQCQDLNQDVCAKRERGIILLNSLGCKADTNCSLSDLLLWENSKHLELTFPCSAVDPENIVQRSPGKYGYHCGDRKSQRNLSVGAHPKRCNSDEDCELQDHSLSTCGCSYRTEKYCVPSWDSDVFLQYWETCEKGGGRMYDFGEYYYWTLVKETYTYQQTPLPCVSDLFTEFYSLRRLATIEDSALCLVLGWLATY